MKRDTGALLLTAGVLLGAGAASTVTALVTYFTRYSAFNWIEGEVGFDLYSSITRMAPAEKAAIVSGGVLIVVALVLLLAGRRRTTARSE